MPFAYIPWPRFDRRAYLLLLDDQDRLMLCGACCRGWTVPQVRINAGANFQGAATRFLANRFGIHDPSYSSLYGLHESSYGDTWEYDRQTSSRVFIVRINAKQSAAIQRISKSHARWRIEDLKSRRREINPEGAVLIATGYVEGWLPDGPVTLY
ncbi:hypothetical protein ACQFX6_17220 [Streptomyces sp. DSM 41987]|uniref:hypothetical protein n=1 Tax=Streptomyces TaxID=1883 RepID=UPI0036213E98